MLTRLVEVTPAFDKRDSDPKKNYGIHGADLQFAVVGPKGAISFVIFTHWQLSHVQKELPTSRAFMAPMPADFSYHSFTPMYEGQVAQEKCKLLGGEPCYYDGSGLHAENVFDSVLIPGGTAALWAYMEKEYEDKFNVEVIQ